MKENLTLQTEAAFERVYDALLGKTSDDLNILMIKLEDLSTKAKEIKEISACLLTGDC